MLDIIFLSPHCDPEADLGEPDSGGQCIYEQELALSLSALPDLRVTTFCRQNGQRPDTSTVNNSYSIQRIECGNFEGVIPKEELEPHLPEFTEKVKKQLEEEDKLNNAILHGHYWDGAWSALFLKNMSEHKLPFIWTPHSLGSTKHRKFAGEENEFQYNFIPRFCWESYAATIADGIVLSSEEEQQSLVYDYAIDESRVHIVPPGVNLPQFVSVDQQDARKKFSLPLEGKILLCLGRMVKTKGYHHAIETLSHLIKKTSDPVNLAIVGGSHHKKTTEQTYATELQQLAQKLGVEKNVFFLPAVKHDEVNQIFSAADIFLMTSEHEPFGLVTVEAMAMKKPVVAANSGGSLNIITHNQTGILVNYNQPERAALYLLSLIKDEDLYARIAEKAYRYAKREFDWYEKSLRFAQIYRQVSRFNPQEIFQEYVQKTAFLRQHFGR